MIELRGKYNTAKVFTDVVDNESISQVIELLNQPYVEGEQLRMMPDIHAGAGCTIGTTLTINNKICPNLVGVDIGCGMEVVRIEESAIDLPELDRAIRTYIPSGFAIRDVAHANAALVDLSELRCAPFVDIARAEKSIGTLGGGNHFIEADKDDDGNIYIVVHSGSRHLGVEIANYYQKLAYRKLNSKTDDIQAAIKELKESGRANMIQKTIEEIKSRWVYIPKHLAYVEGQDFDDYIHDMKIAQRYATQNRKTMMKIILEQMGLHRAETFTTIHNYIDTEHMILRKGSVSAREGEKFIIPINMRDGSLICVGKGNPDWNYSAPHGAGRLMSRSAAKAQFTVEEFAKQMDGIYTTSVGRGTLDECPMAYKDMKDIVSNIEPTVTIQNIIKPIYNFKASDIPVTEYGEED